MPHTFQNTFTQLRPLICRARMPTPLQNGPSVGVTSMLRTVVWTTRGAPAQHHPMGCRALNLVAAPILDPDARLRTDLQAVQRQMRALERLGEESPRAMFFASSGRLMLNLLHGRIDASPGLIRMATAAAGTGSPVRCLDGAPSHGRVLGGPVRGHHRCRR